MLFFPRAVKACLFAACALMSAAAVAQAPASPEPLALPETAAVAVPEPSPSAQALFARTRDGIVQVRVLLSAAGEQSSLGSGFFVRDDGDAGAWVITNYHVIAALAINPQSYRVELRGTNQRLVEADLMAIDVIHDLALLRTRPAPGNSQPWRVLALSEQALAQGSPVFSLGNPLELGFLISEGIYNGAVETGLYEQMLFSGSINSGMSGGPAIDRHGQVVGVNVATMRNGEQLSFLVPVRHARALMDQATPAPPATEWLSQIARQLIEHQRFVTQRLLGSSGERPGASDGRPSAAGFSSQSLAGRTVPTLDGSLTRCWARGRDEAQLRYFQDGLNCTLRDGVFVHDGLVTGTMDIDHMLLRNDRLATAQFLSLDAGAASFFDGHTSELGPNRCQDDYVQLADRVFRTAICVRAFRKLPGLYNYTVRAMQVDDARERLTSRMTLRGFTFDNAQQLGRLFLERLR